MPQIPVFPIGSSGQSIRCTIKQRNATTGALDVVDISTATALKIVFNPPNGQGPISKTASLISGGTTGKMGYTVETGFFDAANKKLCGTWSYQPRFTLGTNVDPVHEIGHFKVVDRLKSPAG